MNAIEMQILFESMLQTTSKEYNNSEKPDTDIIFKYLNLAIRNFIREKYLSSDNFLTRTEILGNSITDLGLLITDTSLSTEVITPPYTYSKILSDKSLDYWHVIKIVTEISRTKPTNIELNQVQLIPINVSYLDRYLTTVNNIPIIMVPVYFEYKPSGENYSEFIVIYDKYTQFNTADKAINMLYLRKPKELNLDVDDSNYTTVCELNSSLHETIVKLAVMLFEEDKYKLVEKQKKGD